VVGPIEGFRLGQRTGEVQSRRTDLTQFSQTDADEVFNPGDILTVQLVGSMGEGERALKSFLCLRVAVFTQARESCPHISVGRLH
jgi:hypothetical protein